MKKIISTLSFILMFVAPLWAQQRTTIKLTALSKKPTIAYTTKSVVVKFDKQSILNTYSALEKEGWVDYYTEEKNAAPAAIAWLKKQKKSVQLDENMADLTTPEHTMAWLIKNLVGVPLVTKGEVELLDLKTNQTKEEIEFNTEITQLSGKVYKFYNPAQLNAFLILWNANERVNFTEEVKGVGVTFEEPVEEIVVEADSNRVYMIPDVTPEYPGGYDKWNEYLKNSLRYPKEAIDNQIEGTIYVAFIVLRNGKLTDISIIKGLSPSCDKEAIRLIQESADWNPGKVSGIPVKTKYVAPIKFRLADVTKK